MCEMSTKEQYNKKHFSYRTLKHFYVQNTEKGNKFIEYSPRKTHAQKSGKNTRTRNSLCYQKQFLLFNYYLFVVVVVFVSQSSFFSCFFRLNLFDPEEQSCSNAK